MTDRIGAVKTALLAASLFVTAAPAQAIEASGYASWVSWEAPHSTVQPNVNCRENDCSDIQWGDAMFPDSPPSFNGYHDYNNKHLSFEVGFPAFEPVFGTAFEFGRLTYENIFTEFGTLTEAQTQVGMTFRSSKNFLESKDFRFNLSFSIDDTPDVGNCFAGCADKIELPPTFFSPTFALDGVTYKFRMLGFGPTAESDLNQLTIKTGTTATTSLWARLDAINLVPVSDIVPASPVPEPETYAMMLAGLGLLGVMARRRKQKLNA
jgi:hypothetical protein